MSESLNWPVVYCYDGSEHSREALASAGRILADSPAYVVTVWRSAWSAMAGAPYATVSPDTVDTLDRAAEDASVKLAEEGAALVPGAVGESIPEDGTVWRSILEFADQHDARLIVVGSRGLSGLRSSVMGSVSHGLLNHSKRPIMVVPAHHE